MNCQKCGSDDCSVRDSRVDGAKRYRRRGCRTCGNRFSTMEILMQEYTEMKNKKDVADKFVEAYEALSTRIPPEKGVGLW